ncbi:MULTISPECIES: GNAT family N-acetyltransferase [Streptomyces]|jgi:ribosomal protein S18 acetylase RimI-like enzyme|uniref:GNAT family N-acetyltransferase n=1 Tax=Streptomyces TaxID=1883 RepID=UPI000BB11826|nr:MULTISPECIES: GNAT family N-acetyltransferase [Streptomyces]PBD00820.1 ribosomal protein S18 acetylase RimI-like enzyme [Streptomyces sp. Ag82_O1-15]SOE77628.1 Ribosomal protein S18 acetylase RimI [Streptomyces sp. OV198]
MGQRKGNGPAVRQAVEYDLVELVRLRALLFEDLGGDFFSPASADDDWLDALAVVLKEQLTSDAVRILVVDGDGDSDGDRGLAACGIATIEQRLPGPHLRNGRIGHVIGVVTDPSYRRRGHSRSIMRGLLDWFGEREVARVDLYASVEGEPLYRELGFTHHPDPALYWRP